MRPEQESRKRYPRFVLPVTWSASMSAGFFQARKVLSCFFLFPMNNCTRSSVVRRHVIGGSSARKIKLEALLSRYVSRLTRKGTSIRKLFKEYHAKYPDGYQLPFFKRIVLEYRFHIKVVGLVQHYASDLMYIDFAGGRLEVVDEMTGETKKNQSIHCRPSVQSLYLLRNRIVAT